MRRIAIILLCFSFLFISPAFGWNLTGSTKPVPATYLTYEVSNTSYVNYLTTEVSTSTVVPGKHSVLGWVIIPMGAQSESLCALYDRCSHAGGNAYDEVIDEAEVAWNDFQGRWLAYPRRLEGTLTINQGPRTKVVVFYDTI